MHAAAHGPAIVCKGEPVMLPRARIFLMLLVIAGATSAACDVTRTEPGRAPEIDVDAEPGRWPEYDVDWANVDVGTTQRTITVPVVRVVQETREISIPYIDINPPGARDREERTVTMEVEAPHAGYQLRIVEVRATNDTLWVIGELSEGAPPANREATRVSDQVVINAPEDLDVRRVMIGTRPSGVFNQQFRFFSDRAALDRAIPSGGRVIYKQ
jgi:hypothetical protein